MLFQSRTNNCGELRLSDAGKKVTLVGWLENIREVGSNFAFLVLRDYYGTTQIVVDSEEMMKIIKGINKESYFVIKNSDEKHKFILASCCTPIRGESVVGFKASDGTITVHRRTCSNANNLAAKFGDKIVSVKWAEEENSDNSYLARVILKGTDRIGMINDITRLTSKDLSVNIRRLNIGTEDGIFDGFIDLYVRDISDLEKLILRLRNIQGIDTVVKTDL